MTTLHLNMEEEQAVSKRLVYQI